MYRAGAFVVPAVVCPAVELALVPGGGGISIVEVPVTRVLGDEGCEAVLAAPVGEAEEHPPKASPRATAAIPATAVCRVVERRAKGCVPATAARYEQTPGAT
ncbi:hypothetical protein GCM10027053_11390 [Intrasporangium mesophilum]